MQFHVIVHLFSGTRKHNEECAEIIVGRVILGAPHPLRSFPWARLHASTALGSRLHYSR